MSGRTLFVDKESQPAQIPALKIISRLNKATKATLSLTQNQEVGGQNTKLKNALASFNALFNKETLKSHSGRNVRMYSYSITISLCLYFDMTS